MIRQDGPDNFFFGGGVAKKWNMGNNFGSPPPSSGPNLEPWLCSSALSMGAHEITGSS